MCVNRDREGWLLVENTRLIFENSLPKCYHDQDFRSKQAALFVARFVGFTLFGFPPCCNVQY